MEQIVDVLIVDDESRNLDALEAILSGEQYRLLRANDADKALGLLLHNDVAAIIMDIQMPGMSGFELAQMIKGTKKFRQIPIVFLTAHMMDDQDVLAGYGAGAVDYLTKPVNPQILRHKISVFAELFRKTRALAELNSTLEERVRERTLELEKSEQALREADRKKDEFLAVLAHELRNPLAPLRTGVDLLLGIQDAKAERTLAIMNRQVQHMVRLIDDLLDVSRISRGVLELKMERTDLAALLGATVDNLKAQFETNGQALHGVFPEPVFAMADPVRLAQIVGNLLHNAGKFTPRGGRVEVKLEKANETATIQVIDNGAGIPKQDLERIFDMFTRVERKTSGLNQGLGIGLALARRITSLHGGQLTVSSAGEGQGACFALSLPIVDAAGARSKEGAPPPSSRAAGPKLKILVIEDNPDSAETMGEWLRDRGHTVETAGDGPRGIEAVKRARPNLVICDIGLPGMSGIEVCRAIRALDLGYRPFLVALSGWGAASDRKETTLAGFDKHFVKPVSLEELSSFLRGLPPG